MADHSSNRLDSWKEIAAFLKRDTRTAMRWAENHGMPIHRYPGHKQPRVFAYRTELDVWLKSFTQAEAGRGPENTTITVSGIQETRTIVGDGIADQSVLDPDFPLLDPRQESQHPAAIRLLPQNIQDNEQFEAESPNGNRIRRISNFLLNSRLKTISLGAFLLVALVGGILRLGVKSAAGSMAIGLVQITDDGRTKQTLRTDGKTLFFDELVGPKRMLASVPIGGGSIHLIPAPFANIVLLDASQDGKSLLILNSEHIDSPSQLWKLPALGGAPTPVGQIHCLTARWSPDGRHIAFTDRSAVYVADAEGDDPYVVASFDGNPFNLLWSRDSKQLRFAVENLTTHTSTAWEIDARNTRSFMGKTATKLPLQFPCCTYWTWADDHGELAYVVRNDERGTGSSLKNQRLFRSGPFGIRKEIAFNAGEMSSLTSDTQGSRLYFVLANTLRGELLRFDTKARIFHGYLPGLSARYLAFSRDGKWMTYSLTQDGSLWRSRSDGTQALQIVGPPMEVQLSSWSPDGSQIAFMGRMPGNPWRIYLVGRDGGNSREMAPGNDNQGAPTWSKDGKTISYGRLQCEADKSCGIFLVELETGRIQLLPESEGLHTARWSPDGNYIAAIERNHQAVQIFDLKEHRWHRLADNVNGNDISWSKDSKSLYLSCLLSEKSSIDKVRISDRFRSMVVDLNPLQKMPGQLDMWFGLLPDDSPIVLQHYSSSEVYTLDSRNP